MHSAIKVEPERLHNPTDPGYGTPRTARAADRPPSPALALCQKSITPEMCSAYPWNVDRLENSLKYFTPRLAFRAGNITVAAKPNALTLYCSPDCCCVMPGAVLSFVCHCSPQPAHAGVDGYLCEE